jgi:hypothetical protein
MKRFLFALLAVSLVCAASCKEKEGASNTPPPAAKEQPAQPAQHPAPTPTQAKDLIANAPEFGDYQFTNAAVTIPLKRSAMRADQAAIAKALAGGGWIRFDGDDVKTKEDKRLLVRPNGTLDVVPLAKKELVSVDAVRGEKVDFTWKWIPNEIGALLKDRFAGDQKATATLLWDGTNWTVLRIAGR